ncbi:Uncharacterised protein [Segatella copri]|nr:Uncharacterised protein [Segatella copri]
MNGLPKVVRTFSVSEFLSRKWNQRLELPVQFTVLSRLVP